MSGAVLDSVACRAEPGRPVGTDAGVLPYLHSILPVLPLRRV